MSWRINKITIENYRFFHDKREIELGENNLLVYGENGSGKTSVSEALYNVYRSRYISKNEAQVPFTVNDNSSRNIYSSPAEYSGIIVEYTNKQVDPAVDESREVSNNAVTTQHAGDNFFKLTVSTSDFLNYKNLLSLSDFSEIANDGMFKKFVDDIFPYTDFRKGYIKLDGTNSGILRAEEWWKYIQQCLANLPRHRSTRRRSQYNRAASEYRKFLELLVEFHKELRYLAETIAQRCTQILETEFKIMDVEIFFNLDPEFVFNMPTAPGSHHRDHKLHDFEIKLAARVKNAHLPGGSTIIYNPKTFFNEAKLACMGMALRFAVVDTRFSAADCAPLLCIDDLMISLDMSYRIPAINFILNYVNKYQLCIFTHDRSFYELIKSTIEDKKQKNWKFIQMYSPNADNVLDEEPAPNFFPDEGYKEQAKSLMKAGDYLAAANYLRKFAEQQIKAILPMNFWFDLGENGYTKKMLSNLLSTVKSDEFCNKYGFVSTDFPDITSCIKRVLNPLSHDDRDTQIFKKELDDSIVILEEFEKKAKSKHILCGLNDLKHTRLKLYVADGGRSAELTLRLTESWDYFLMDDGTRKYKKVDVQIKDAICSPGVYFSNGIKVDIATLFKNAVFQVYKDDAVPKPTFEDSVENITTGKLLRDI